MDISKRNHHIIYKDNRREFLMCTKGTVSTGGRHLFTGGGIYLRLHQDRQKEGRLTSGKKDQVGGRSPWRTSQEGLDRNEVLG